MSTSGHGPRVSNGLRSAVEGLGLSMHDADLELNDALRERTLAAVGRLPVEMGPLLQLLRLDAGDVDGLIRCLSHAATLATRVLALANSAAFGAAYPLTTIKRAVLHLGVKRCRAAAMCQALRMLNQKTQGPGALVDQVTITCVAKAYAARDLAECLGLDSPDEAFTQALVQDLGLLMLMMLDGGFYESRMPGDCMRFGWLEAERRQFGIDHAALGAVVLKDQNVERSLVLAARHHHETPTDLDDNAAHSLLPAFTAGLFPHIDTEPWTGQKDWLDIIFSHWLSARHDSPASFMNEAYARARQFIGQTNAPFDHIQLVARLTESVTADMLDMIVDERRLEAEVEQKAALVSSMRTDALTDPLTRLLNRRGFEQLANRRIEQAAQRELSCVLMMIDLDGFKPINDTHGHDAGDLVLRGVAKMLRRQVSGSDLLGRLGGDEFAGLIIGPTRENARKIAQRITRSARGVKCRISEEVTVPVGMSVGLVFISKVDANTRLEYLLQLADELMYQQKRSGKRGLIWHEPSMNGDPGQTMVMDV